MLGTVRRLLAARRNYQEEKVRQDENWQKRGEVGKKVMALYGRYQSMMPTVIIDELFQMHDYFEMPIYWFIGHYETISYSIFSYTARHPKLTAQDAERLAQMLLWPEVKRFFADNSCRLAILGACERFPTEEVVRILHEHFPFAQAQLEEERKGYFRDQWFGTEYVLTAPAGGVGTHRYADLSHEVSRLETLLSH